MSKDSPKDLKVRTASAIVMIAIAGSALWAGGWVFTTFVAIVAAGLLWEWWGLISKFNTLGWSRTLWMLGGVVYVGAAVNGLLNARFNPNNALYWTIWLVTVVIATDVGAYLFGRFIGGPKIAPQISPSKTWMGLVGGVLFTGVVMIGMYIYPEWQLNGPASLRNLGVEGVFTLGILWSFPLVFLAQVGDFFESWMKRKAGVKDSGSLIPGHGGLLDRLDGLLPVAIAFMPWIGGLLR
jgi:phosphatidate cytidylyltransferase